MSARAPLHHLDLNVSDLDRSRRFYDRILTHLGYRPIDYSAAGEPDGWDWLAPDSVGRFSIGLYRSKHPERAYDRYSPGLHHIAFAASSREDVDELCHSLGGQFQDQPRRMGRPQPHLHLPLGAGVDFKVPPGSA
jgi:glyoxylase I family protein